MLNKTNRISKAKEFAFVFKKTTPIHTKNFIFRIFKNIKNTEMNRFGFIISNKVQKSAVKRNFLKRRMRAAARELILKISSGYDIVVVVKQSEEKMTYIELEQQFLNAFKKANLI